MPKTDEQRSGILRRLAGPFLLFSVFGALVAFSPEINREMGAQALDETRRVIRLAVLVGAWLAAALLVNRLLAVFFWEQIIERALAGPVPRLVKSLTGAVVILIAVAGIVSFVFERDVTGLWATSGAIGLLIGFALQSMILDVATGIAIGIDRPYRIGDWIQVHQRQRELYVTGQITQVNWRTTRLRTIDNNMVVIPNSVMGQSIVTNFMAPDPRSRLKIELTLDLSVPRARACRVLEAGVLAACGGVKKAPLRDPAPKVRVVEHAGTIGVTYSVRFWIIPADCGPKRARHIVISSVLDHLDHAGLGLAYPKRDLFNTTMPQRQLDADTPADLASLLGRIDLFADLTESELELLASRIKHREFGRGDELIRAGDDGDSMFVLLEGLVYVFAEQDGETVQVAQIPPGGFFGEMSLLTGEPRSATVTAASPTLACEIARPAVEELLSRRPSVAEQISRVVARRRLSTAHAFEESANGGVEERTRSMAGNILGRMRSFFRGLE